jgi:hypothetical protein
MKRTLIALAIFAALVVPKVAHAQNQAVGYYHTKAAGGMENSAVVLSAAGSGSARFLLGAAVSYNTSAAEVAMCFDASSLPANATIPMAVCPLGTASSTAAPATCSFSLPMGGAILQNGLVCGCSTTGKTLTIDTTSGGNCAFYIGFTQ